MSGSVPRRSSGVRHFGLCSFVLIILGYMFWCSSVLLSVKSWMVRPVYFRDVFSSEEAVAVTVGPIWYLRGIPEADGGGSMRTERQSERPARLPLIDSVVQLGRMLGSGVAVLQVGQAWRFCVRRHGVGQWQDHQGSLGTDTVGSRASMASAPTLNSYSLVLPFGWAWSAVLGKGLSGLLVLLAMGSLLWHTMFRLSVPHWWANRRPSCFFRATLMDLG